METMSRSVSFSHSYLSPPSPWLTGRGFCRRLCVGERHSPGPHFSRHVTYCTHPNERNASNFSFPKYSQEIKEPNFFKRLVHAWQVLFPLRPKPVSNAELAKQRLKMILISDRCAISEDARRKIVDNVVGALSSFVEIESEEKVQLNVSADPDLGTLYSVIVPIRRVKPQYQDHNDVLKNMSYGDAFGHMRTLDLRFEYPDRVDKE